MINFDKIKLIIWDLDDTFWHGTLSEGVVTPIDSNIALIKSLTDCGIVNSICSKNDSSPVNEKLSQLGVLDYFVFASIDWTPKGERIKHMIEEMGFRPVNVLFIDDNIVNLNEAIFFAEGLMTAEPSVISELIKFIENAERKDLSHSRLQNYKVLELKQRKRSIYTDNTDFLFSTHTQVTIKKDCISVIDRIHELILRTNQLNFTKNRMSLDDLFILINDSEVDAGYVEVKDDFGDYGIVGFYAVKDKKCIHFLFSCRTIGQGVEQYVYSTIGWPELPIIGDVVSNVEKTIAPAWINQLSHQDKKEDTKSKIDSGKIIFKGPCDLELLTSFLNSSLLSKEFTYIGEKSHNSIEHQNHSVNYMSFKFLSQEQKQSLLNDCIFNDQEMFETSVFDKDVSLIFISTLIEPNLGIYERKSDKLKIAFGEWCYPLTDESNWGYYITKGPYQNTFKKEWLQSFREKYSFIGRTTVEHYVNSLNDLLLKINRNAKICLILGSEMPYEKNEKKAYVGRELYHKELNSKIKEFTKTNKRVYLLDFNDYITNQNDFLDNINHFQRNVYYKAAKRANEIISEVCGYEVEEASKISLFLDKISVVIRAFFDPKSQIYFILRKVFHRIRD